MTSEECAEYLKEFYRNALKGADPQFMEAIKKAIELAVIDASKQKIKENKENNA